MKSTTHNLILNFLVLTTGLILIGGSVYLVQVYNWSAWVIFWAVVISPSISKKTKKAI